MIQENVGVQDQYTCALGGLQHLTFETSGRISGTSVDLGPSRMMDLQSHLMLFHTGLVRHAHEVLVEQMENTRQGKVAVDLDALSRLVDDGLHLLRSGGPIAQFGELLDAAWRAKQRLSSRVSNDGINDLYRRARGAGAIGGKLLGAGGGGFFLLFVAPADQSSVLEAIGAQGHIAITTETSGARVVYQEQ